MKNQAQEIKKNLPLIIMFIGGLLVFLIICAFSINKPLTTDEAEFASAAQAINQLGNPIYYVGDVSEILTHKNDLWIFQKTPYKNHQYGLWHSPLYLYLMAFTYRLLGISDWSSRLPGAFCLLLSLTLMGAILLQFNNRQKAISIFTYLSFLYFINPYIVQMGLMVDFDNTIMNCALLFFLHQYLRFKDQKKLNFGQVFYLSLLLALSTWCKEYAGLYLFAAFFIYEFLSRQWYRVLSSLYIFLSGTCIFIGSWLLYCQMLDLPADYILRFSYIRRVTSSSKFELITDIISMLGWKKALTTVVDSALMSTVWTSPFFWLIIVWAIIERGMTIFRQRCLKMQTTDLFLILSFIILFLSKVLRPSIGSLKYEYPAYAFLTLFISCFLEKSIGPLCTRKTAGLLLTAILLAAVHAIFLKDPILVIFETWRKASSLYILFPYFLVLILTGMILYLSKKLTAPYALFALVTFLSACNLGLDWIQLRPYNTSPSWLISYGEMHLGDMADHLSKILTNEETPILRKDLGFKVRTILGKKDFRWMESVILKQLRSREEILEYFENPKINYFVIDRINHNPLILNVLKEQFELQKNFSGNFLLFGRKEKKLSME